MIVEPELRDDEEWQIDLVLLKVVGGEREEGYEHSPELVEENLKGNKKAHNFGQ